MAYPSTGSAHRVAASHCRDATPNARLAVTARRAHRPGIRDALKDGKSGWCFSCSTRPHVACRRSAATSDKVALLSFGMTDHRNVLLRGRCSQRAGARPTQGDSHRIGASLDPRGHRDSMEFTLCCRSAGQRFGKITFLSRPPTLQDIIHYHCTCFEFGYARVRIIKPYHTRVLGPVAQPLQVVLRKGPHGAHLLPT